ncbi:dihydroorotate dehydrogenase electron transfer subunit [Myxococcota bacterium]|nr:dihydroorotate dehydrogenase electron transfer subunit [Myxococcota bacterium]
MRDPLVEVLYNRDLGGGYFALGLLDPVLSREARPGQFVMIEVASGRRVVPEPLLRRPFSVQRSVETPRGAGYQVLYRVVGAGTTLMSRLREGDQVHALGPLGRPFTPADPGGVSFLVGGGVGIPPLVALADTLDRGPVPPRYEVFLGVRSAADAPCFDGFVEARAGGVHIRTDDGSLGQRGTAVQALVERWDRDGGPPAGARVYSCGPMGMLRAVARACEGRGVPCEISVETLMGCGLGACMGCVIRARDAGTRPDLSPYDRWLLACVRGPVFDSRDVDLDAGPPHP